MDGGGKKRGKVKVPTRKTDVWGTRSRLHTNLKRLSKEIISPFIGCYCSDCVATSRLTIQQKQFPSFQARSSGLSSIPAYFDPRHLLHLRLSLESFPGRFPMPSETELVL